MSGRGAGRRAFIAAAAFAAAPACTTVTIAHLPTTAPGRRPITVTTSGVGRPYESLGLVQIYRAGVTFGWLPVPTTVELQTVLEAYLLPEAERRGADAVINFRFHESQYTPALRTIMTIPPFILVPLPTSVTVSGELVRFLPEPASPAAQRL